LACSTLLLATALYEDIFLPKWQTHEYVERTTASGDTVVGIADTHRIPSTIEAVLRILIPLFALAGLAAYTARLAPEQKVLNGAGASAMSALLTLSVLQFIMARKVGVSYIPRDTTVALWTAVSLSIGAAASWVFAVWWPNKSLERTREG
jgi:hypothetical protein